MGCGLWCVDLGYFKSYGPDSEVFGMSGECSQ